MTQLLMEVRIQALLELQQLMIKTLQIDLTYDCPYFEEIMAFPATFPVRRDMVEAVTTGHLIQAHTLVMDHTK